MGWGDSVKAGGELEGPEGSERDGPGGSGPLRKVGFPTGGGEFAAFLGSGQPGRPGACGPSPLGGGLGGRRPWGAESGGGPWRLRFPTLTGQPPSVTGWTPSRGRKLGTRGSV